MMRAMAGQLGSRGSVPSPCYCQLAWAGPAVKRRRRSAGLNDRLILWRAVFVSDCFGIKDRLNGSLCGTGTFPMPWATQLRMAAASILINGVSPMPSTKTPRQLSGTGLTFVQGDRNMTITLPSLSC